MKPQNSRVRVMTQKEKIGDHRGQAHEKEGNGDDEQRMRLSA
jgi:hypothetical protein